MGFFHLLLSIKCNLCHDTYVSSGRYDEIISFYFDPSSLFLANLFLFLFRVCKRVIILFINLIVRGDTPTSTEVIQRSVFNGIFSLSHSVTSNSHTRTYTFGHICVLSTRMSIEYCTELRLHRIYDCVDCRRRLPLDIRDYCTTWQDTCYFNVDRNFPIGTKDATKVVTMIRQRSLPVSRSADSLQTPPFHN